MEARKARITRAEIIRRQLDAFDFEAGRNRSHTLGIVNQGTFPDLQLE
jgi:hypothetical protein